MSSKSSRRRQRKSKQKAKIANKANCNINYADKFKIIEKEISNLLVCAYIRQIKPHGRVNMHMVPYEIQNICVCYFNDESIKTKWIDTVILPLIRKITYEQEPSTYAFRTKQRIEYEERKKNKKLKIIKSIVKFNDTFNELTSYDKRLVCKRITKQKYPIYKLILCPIENDNKPINTCFNQLYFLEYILWKRYKTLNHLDLCDMNLNDNHVLYLCNCIENLVKYITIKKQQRNKELKSKDKKNSSDHEKHSKQKPDKKLQNKSNIKNQIQNSQKTNDKPVYSKNKRAQREIERQLEKMKEMKEKQDKIVEIKMKLKIIDFSDNNMTDKHMSLLLRMIKKRICSLETLDLSSNKITNKSLSVIMKYNIKGLKIELSNCKGVTLKGLNKYKRTDYDNETPIKYVYCENMVYFVNEKEESEQQNKPKGGKYVRGKGKKFRGNRKRMLYTGMDGIETGYLSTDMCDWWNYQ